MTVFADSELAARLSALVVAEMRAFVTTAHILERNSPAEALEAAGGIAVFVGPGSLLNQAAGMGFSGPVLVHDVERVERFFGDRGEQPRMLVVPLAHPTLVESLSLRGWVPDGFENVLVRELSADEPFDAAEDGVEVYEVVTESERDDWALLVATGFSAPLTPPAEQLVLADIVAHRPGPRLFYARVNGALAGTGELVVADGVGWLSADTTMPAFRRRGVQQALQRHRLRVAAEEGCKIAVSEAQPGSGSQRNMERLGFRVAYTQFDMVVPRATVEEGL